MVNFTKLSRKKKNNNFVYRSQGKKCEIRQKTAEKQKLLSKNHEKNVNLINFYRGRNMNFVKDCDKTHLCQKITLQVQILPKYYEKSRILSKDFRKIQKIAKKCEFCRKIAEKIGIYQQIIKKGKFCQKVMK